MIVGCRRGEERRGIPGLDIWDNLDPDITLERVLSPVSQPGGWWWWRGIHSVKTKTKYKELDIAWCLVWSAVSPGLEPEWV